MGRFWQRIKNLWVLSKLETPESLQPLFKKKEYAEFIMPDRVDEILSSKPDASITDVIQ